MKKDLIFSTVLALALAVSLAGCNKDDDEVYIDVPSEDVFTQTCDSVRVDFHLLNERGDTTTVFREGEDIIFDLTIQNLGHSSIAYGLDKDLLGPDIFRVYTADGRNCGTACTYDEFNLLVAGSLLKDYPFHWQVSWRGKFTPRYPFDKTYKGNNHLSSGMYYTVAPITCGHIRTKCQIHFQITTK